MKKTVLTLSGCAMLAISATGRTAPAIRYACYEVDGVVTYDIKGSVPGSSIQFYSKPWGGDLLKEIVTDEAGHAIVAWSGQKAPAFVLNKPAANGSGVSGNGMVAVTPEKEFSLAEIGATTGEGQVTIRWAAAVSHPDRYVFEVLKTINGRDYSPVKTVAAQMADRTAYAFSERLQATARVAYKIQVRDAGGDVLYASAPMSAYSLEEISVYPTIAKNAVNIRLPQHTTGTYSLLDAQGRVLSAGTLSDEQNSVDVAKLPAGNYFMRVSSEGNNTTAKFVKE